MTGALFLGHESHRHCTCCGSMCSCLQKTDPDLRAIVAASVGVVVLLTVGCGAVTVPLLERLLARTEGSDAQELLLPAGQEEASEQLYDAKQPPPKSLIHKWWRALDASWLQPLLGGRSVRIKLQLGSSPELHGHDGANTP
jgi:hypothetical protein